MVSHTNKIVGSSDINDLQITGANSGVIDGTAFSNIQDIDLKGGDTAKLKGMLISTASLTVDRELTSLYLIRITQMAQ